VRSLAAKSGISLAELDNLPGSGLNGRFTKEDLLAYIENRGKTNVTTVSAPAAVAPKPAQSEAPVNTPAPQAKAEEQKEVKLNEWLDNGTKIVPMDNMRKAISEHMVRSKRTSPHVYSIQEADVTNISKWRAAHKDEFKKKEGFNLSFTPFFMEAAVKALQEYSIVNSSVDGQRIIYKKNVNLGCAVAIGTTGLIVPVIKKAEEKNFVGLARGLNDIALRARNKKLSPDEVMDGSFTITNPGIFGTMIGTPIINQPQAAILCLGAIEKRPVVVDDMIAIRERCFLTLSYDHRIIDGSVGAQFLAYICKHLAEWDLNRPLY
jgi:2-oxoglutarate dehydrogenase E2 component (dihydrolipoamide succinyltransferase)